MHPAVLFSLLWSVILLLHFVFSFTLLKELFPISLSTYFIFLIGVLSFSFGSFIETVLWQKKAPFNDNKYLSENEISLHLRLILLGVVILGLPLYIQATYRLFITSNIDDFFIGLRTELSYGDEDIGPTKYLLIFSFIVYAINLHSFLKEKKTINKVLCIVSLWLVIIYSIFYTGRTYFLIIVAIYMGLNHLGNKSFSIKKMIWLISIFMLVFITIGIIYGKGGNTEDSIKQNIEPAAQTTALYMVTSLNALEYELNDNFEVNYTGNHSLRFFRKIGERLNLIPNLKIDELVQPFVFVPYPTNVYTVYSPYIRDFGRVYAWLMMAFFGFIHTWLYYKALSIKDLRYSLYYSFLLFPLLISFFMDFYLTTISMWIQIIFFIELALYLNKFLIYRKMKNSVRKI
jgi:oligosaccharide repeat unit polymerase